jgi:hypothetical protein
MVKAYALDWFSILLNIGWQMHSKTFNVRPLRNQIIPFSIPAAALVL